MPSRRGKRSLKAQVKGYIYRISHRDRLLCETVCTTSRHQLLDWVTANHTVETGINLSEIPDVEPGLVLVNSRGDGAFQR